MIPSMSARPRKRRAPSTFRIHSLWLTALIAASLIAVVVGFATDTRRTAQTTNPYLYKSIAKDGPWLKARRVGVLPAAIQDPAAAPVAGHGAILLGGLDSNDTSVATAQLVGVGPHRTLKNLSVPLHDAAAATVGSFVYLFGGGQTASFNGITRVNPSTGRAQQVGQLPEPRSDLAAATIGRTVYLVGGFTGVQPLKTILAWTPHAAGASSKPQVVGTLPEPLRYASVAASGGKLVIAGGITPHGHASRIESFDPQTGRVTKLGVLPAPVSHAPAVALGRYVYVLGGQAANGAPTREIYAIDPRKGKVWLAGHLPAPLSDAAGASFEGGIVLAGGHSTSGTVGDISYLTPAPRPKSMQTTALLRTGSDPSVLPGDVVIADKHNNRLVQVTPQGQVVWSFPLRGELGHGQRFKLPDDAFYTPDGREIVATEEDYFVISVIDIANGRIVYRYGHPGQAGPGSDYLWNPDDAIMLPSRRIIAADIKNCRLIELKPPLHRPVAQMGTTQVCGHNPPAGFGSPNGAFPTTGGGTVVTEITGDWVDVFNGRGHLVSAFNAPGFTYPSDTNEVKPGVFLSADYAKPGKIETFNAQGKLLWSFSPHGPGALNHPSLALPLPNGDIIANDDNNNRVIVIDPHTNRIVWQYGHTGVRGSKPGYLFTPDGLDLSPPYSLADRFPNAKGLPVR
jgi:outer membrane protein assembly factor BamB